VWHILTNNLDCHDLGANHFTRRNLRRITRQANTFGFTIRFDPIPLASPARCHHRVTTIASQARARTRHAQVFDESMRTH
jgi:hypothetical protein